MDLLFGTYRCPDHEPERFGINQPAPKTYLGFMVRPLLPRVKRSKPMKDVPSLAAEERSWESVDERAAV